jgi:hypothetical protein
LTNDAHAAFADPGVTATDTCSGVMSLTTNSNVRANWAGSYSIEYVATDPAGNSTTNSRVVVVVDNPPMAGDLTLGAVSGTPATLQIVNGKYPPSDPDNDPLTVTALSAPAHGIAATDGTNVIYTSEGAFVGTDAFTYTVSDGFGGAVTRTITVAVAGCGPGYNQVAMDCAAIPGKVILRYVGIPYLNYALECAHDLTPPIPWTPLLTNQVDAAGSLSFTNTPSGGSDFYRTVWVP